MGSAGHLWAWRSCTGLCELFQGADCSFLSFSRGSWPPGWVTSLAPLPASQSPPGCPGFEVPGWIKGINGFSVLRREGISSPLGGIFQGSREQPGAGSGPPRPQGSSCWKVGALCLTEMSGLGVGGRQLGAGVWGDLRTPWANLPPAAWGPLAPAPLVPGTPSERATPSQMAPAWAEAQAGWGE